MGLVWFMGGIHVHGFFLHGAELKDIFFYKDKKDIFTSLGQYGGKDQNFLEKQ